MSSCLSGGGRACRLNLELIKSPSTSWTSYSSSPSSTLSGSNNSPVTITTRKPRTPRKRPNQIYNEAASILSKAYPKIFSHKHLTKPGKFTKPCYTFAYEVRDLLLPLQIHALDNSEFLLHLPRIEKPNIICNESKVVNSFHRPLSRTESSSTIEKRRLGTPCRSPGEINANENFLDFRDELQEDFDAESILDEGIKEGIDSIMGDITQNNNHESLEEFKNGFSYTTQMMDMNTCYGYPVGMGYYDNNIIDNYGYALRREAFRNASDQFDEWRFSRVNVTDITPKFNKITSDTKKKKKKVDKCVELKNLGKGNSSGLREAKGKDNLIKIVLKKEEYHQHTPMSLKRFPPKKEVEETIIPKPNDGLKLKLNYDVVLNAWSDRSTPLPDELLNSKGSANDVQARLSKMDLFTEDGGLTEASVPRYKEKRPTRLFPKKIRCQVSKVNDDQRPKTKGRLVRRPDSPHGDTNEDIYITT